MVVDLLENQDNVGIDGDDGSQDRVGIDDDDDDDEIDKGKSRQENQWRSLRSEVWYGLWNCVDYLIYPFILVCCVQLLPRICQFAP